ncbi:hypothetical protein [Streptomyces sp. NPDC048496]|uniref:hypothetical protein n=1 Tax=Streptomyces sp. NPDC048496 TaxID=3365558 RepID=UPI003720A88F
MNRACGPLAGGTFRLRADGLFSAESAPPRFQSCPRLTTPGPDLLHVVARAAYVTVGQPDGSATRTLRFLDSRKRLVALWREDTTTRSTAQRAAWCEKALGGGATSDGTFTTVERVREQHMSATNAKAEDVLPDVPDGTVAGLRDGSLQM